MGGAASWVSLNQAYWRVRAARGVPPVGYLEFV
jgi:hypothetical protein